MFFNVGVNDTVPKGTIKIDTTAKPTRTKSLRPSIFKTARQAAEFQFRFRLAPGAYEIVLGFVEFHDPNCAMPGKRVFSVYVNDVVQLEALDIFATVGCYAGYEVQLPLHTVGSINTEPTVIRFTGIAGDAVLSYLAVRPAVKECIPEFETGGLADDADHAAHAIPGTYPPQLTKDSPKSYVDRDNDGFVSVNIDGSGSHTHYFDAENGIRGRLTQYTWSIVDTGEIVSKKVEFTYNFPLGSTRLRLAVVDNSCSTDEAETTVTVTKSIQPGMYCYYYAGLVEPLMGGTLNELSPRPQFSAVSTQARFKFPAFSFRGTLFAARCIFFLEVDTDNPASKIKLIPGGGHAQLYKGQDLIVDTNTNNEVDTPLAVGLTAFEMIYHRTDLSKKPSLALRVNNKLPAKTKLYHDQSTVLPILTNLSPKEGRNEGGARVKVEGYGLFQPLTVKFGSSKVDVLPDGQSSTAFFVKSPAVTTNAVVDIFVTTTTGVVSNPVAFQYGSACNSVSFEETEITKQNGDKIDNIGLPTCVTIGQDGKLYMGTLGGSIQVVGYDAGSLLTTSHCYSKRLVDNNYRINGAPSQRDILGVAFNPADAPGSFLLYASSSTLFWHAPKNNRIDYNNSAAWRNGAVERFKPGTDPTDDGVCMVYDRRIVTGFPVSNHDHAVNGLIFTQDGDLLVNVAGNTNMGLPGYRLGNAWETLLSGAIILVRITDPDFDGTINYINPDSPQDAIPQNGFIETYATGFRNPFSIAMTTGGDYYCTDQGPNCGFGNVATACSDYDEDAAAAYKPLDPVDWPSAAEIGGSTCPWSIDRPDKVIHITQGSWYGHPNIARGLAGDTKQCAYIDPFTDKTALDESPGSGYKESLRTLESSVTAIGEYRANHFCGKLKNELILSTYEGGSTYRMGVQKNRLLSGPDELSKVGGIAFVEDAHGNLIFPMLAQQKVRVLKPRSNVAGVFVAGVAPWRHGRSGGSLMTIGGSNFGASVTVNVGSAKCDIIRAHDREIVCRVPPGRGLKDVVVKRDDGEEGVAEEAVLYMNV